MRIEEIENLKEHNRRLAEEIAEFKERASRAPTLLQRLWKVEPVQILAFVVLVLAVFGVMARIVIHFTSGGIGQSCYRDGSCIDNLECVAPAYLSGSDEWKCVPSRRTK